MPSLILRLLPVLALLGVLAWGDRDDLTSAVAANGMTIDPNGGGAGGSPVVIEDPTDPDQ